MVETLKTSPLIFPDLCVALFDGTATTGHDSWGPSCGRVRTRDTSLNLEVVSLEDISFSTQGQGFHLLSHQLPIRNLMLPLLILREKGQRKKLGVHQNKPTTLT